MRIMTKLEQARIKMGLSQTTLAADVGTYQPVISKLERMEGSSPFLVGIGIGLLTDLANYLSLEVEELTNAADEE